MGFFIRDKGRLIFLQQNQFFWSRQQVLRAPKFEGTHLQKKKVVHLHRSTKHPDWEREQHAEPFVLRRHPQCIVLGRPMALPPGHRNLGAFSLALRRPSFSEIQEPTGEGRLLVADDSNLSRVTIQRQTFFLGGEFFYFLDEANPFRAPSPLPILNPGNFVPKTGFQW